MAGVAKGSIRKILEFWKEIDKKTKSRIILLAILMAVTLSVASVFINTTDYSLLYSDLELRESSEIISILEGLGIKSRLSGSSVLVDKKHAETARMQLALQGYPKSGINYDLFNSSMGLTAGSKDKEVMIQYQLQERLGGIIGTLNGVRRAIVTISIPETDVFRFKGETSPVSACVVLEPERGYYFTPEQVRAIEHLMITSISGLGRENLSVIDTDLNDLNYMNKIESGGAASERQLLEKGIEEELKQKIQYMFEPVFGVDNIKTSVKVSIDLDKKNTEIIQYTPVTEDVGIPYMIDEFREKMSDSTETSSQENSANIVKSDSFNERVQNVVSYRVNELRQTIEEAQGTVTDISLSILINKPELDANALDDLKRIAAAAVGIDISKIAVGVMEFAARGGLEEQMESILERDMPAASLLSEKAILSLVAIILAFVFAVMLLKTLKQQPVGKTVTKKDSPGAPTDEQKEGLVKVMEIIQENSTEKKMIEEIQKYVRTNPKDIAEVLSYWMDNGN